MLDLRLMRKSAELRQEPAVRLLLSLANPLRSPADPLLLDDAENSARLQRHLRDNPPEWHRKVNYGSIIGLGERSLAFPTSRLRPSRKLILAWALCMHRTASGKWN